MASRIQQAEILIAQQTFDLIILCYTLSKDECLQIAGLAQALNERTKILALGAVGAWTPPAGVDQLWTTEAGPDRLLSKAAEMLGLDLNRKPARAV